MRPLLGAHVSAAGGYDKAIDRGEELGAEVIQVFVSSPRSWRVNQPETEVIKRFKKKKEGSLIKKIYAHGTYLANLGTPKLDLLEKSKTSLRDEFRVVTSLGMDGLIFHVGSKNGQPTLPLKQVVSAIKEAIKYSPGESQIIIENAAGGGEKIGSSPEEIFTLLEVIDSPRVKVCYDTAHGFEAGLIANYTPKEITKLLDRFEKSFGLKNLVALHVNDSKTVFNSRHDRHENLGEGYIGLSGFKNLAKEKRLAHTSWILEVPGFDDLGPDKKNMDILKSCFR
ncbi:MAG: deoxyribonuclease IV [Anaplasmataceae bacterium]|nr:deoxyribonuclease IV [Anaplasmataceae bacterium]